MLNPITAIKQRMRGMVQEVVAQQNADLFNMLRRQMYWEYRQNEAIVALYSHFDFVTILPPARLGAASPDLMMELTRIIEQRRPQVVVELGAGLSTVVTAYALEKCDCGHITTLEHDPAWAETARGYVEQHKLSHRSEVKICPLVPTTVGERTTNWYDLSQAGLEPKSIDLLVVDGPPAWGVHDPMSRYPAVPQLAEYLADDAVIVQDDAFREGEQESLRLWDEQYGPLEIKRPQTEKGMTVVEWASRTNRS